MADDSAVLKALESHGESLAVGLGIVASDAFDDGTLEIRGGPAVFLPPGQMPEECPNRGALLRHSGDLVPPTLGSFVMGWFLSEDVITSMESAAGSPEAGAEKLKTLAFEFAENLATDKYKLGESRVIRSEDLWADYLSGELPPEIAWQRFFLSGAGHPDWCFYFAWPRSVVERMFGPPPAPPAPPPPVSAKSPAPAAVMKPISPTVNRLLRTEVPIIVTLASKQENAGKLLHLGPGSIIEFSQSCDSPLQLSVNNLPIGLGEAVKIGDHFGLKIVEIVPAEERLERLGNKWPY